MNKYQMMEKVISMLNEITLNEVKKGNELFFNLVGYKENFKAFIEDNTFFIAYLDTDNKWYTEDAIEIN